MNSINRYSKELREIKCNELGCEKAADLYHPKTMNYFCKYHFKKYVKDEKKKREKKRKEKASNN